MAEKLFVAKNLITKITEDSVFYWLPTEEETKKIKNIAPEELERMLDEEGLWVELIELESKSPETEALIKKVNDLTKEISYLLTEANDSTKKTSYLFEKRRETFKKVKKEYGLKNYVHYYIL